MAYAAGKRGLMSLLLVLGIAPGAICSESEVGRDADGFEAHLVLQNGGGREASQFRAGESITLILILRNTSDAPRTISLPSAQSYDFAISSEAGREIWRWSQGRLFAQMLTELSFEPGETQLFTITWDQIRTDGQACASGSYRATAHVPTEAPGTTAPPVAFEIR